MPFRIGIALGGGGARGLAHIGVLRELMRNGIPIYCVTGASIGSIIGAIFARRGSIEDVELRVSNFLGSDIFQKAQLHALAQKDEDGAGWVNTLTGMMRKAVLYTYGVTRRSIIDVDEYKSSIGALIEDVEIEDLKLPFAAVATDIIEAKQVVFTSGSLRLAVEASCAIPGIFPPVEEGNRLMVDGGWVNPVPVEPCRRLGADIVIAVDISQDLEENSDFKRSINIILRTNIITRVILREIQLKDADFIIRPAVGSQHWADFSNIKEAIELGAEAARNSIPVLKSLMKRKRRWSWLVG